MVDLNKVNQIKTMAENQIQNLLQLSGEDIKGTNLELSLKLALQTIKGSVEQSNSHNSFEQSSTNKVPEVKVDNDDYSQDENEEYYNNDYDEDDYDDYYDDYEPIVPEGFENNGEYQEFLASQEDVLPTYTDDEGNEQTMFPDTVVGTTPNEDGTTKEVGNMDEALGILNEALEEKNTIRDDETGEVLVRNEIPEVNHITVKMTRENGLELTNEQVRNNILTNPVSNAMLKYFGKNYHIEPSNKDNEKLIVFAIDNNDDKTKLLTQGLIHGDGLVMFGGKSVIPGLGMIVVQTIA